MRLLIRTLSALIVLVCIAPVQATEVIRSFHSDITVAKDGSMVVRETIRVHAEGHRIRRGIFRDFPTDYTDRFGNRVQVQFETVEVTRDGRPEHYRTERRSNGVRVYIGRKDVFLQAGDYDYTLTYRTDRQLGFFEQHDELYWNVTGNGWEFPIERASAEVRLPPSVPREGVGAEAYTGPQGARGRAYEAYLTSQGTVRFETTEALGVSEGLTIVTTWPKGHVTQPTTMDNFVFILRDNPQASWGLAGLALLLGYYVAAWWWVGRDPEKGVIVPRYTPPKGFSPAALRYLRRMGYDDKSFASGLVGLAVKGLIQIADQGGGGFVVSKTPKKGIKLSAGEQAIYVRLFAKGPSVELEAENHEVIGSAMEGHATSLEHDFGRGYFALNSAWLVPGVLISIGILVGLLVILPPRERVGAGFLCLFLIIGGLNLGAVMVKLLARANADGGERPWLAILLTSVIPLIALLVLVCFLHTILESLSLIGVGVVVLATCAHALFYHLLKAPTHAGRRILDKIEGFRHYLVIAEKDELNLKHPPKRTPELFEAYLPFALALDVEQQWADKFAGVLAATSAPAPADGRERYRNEWYRGRSSRDVSSMATNLGSSLGSAIASSSTPPGSSSGTSGGSGFSSSSGGSSGGGGGGGGGGGW